MMGMAKFVGHLTVEDLAAGWRDWTDPNDLLRQSLVVRGVSDSNAQKMKECRRPDPTVD